MTVERFERLDPASGRPMIGRLRVNGGQVEIRVDREDRSLWLFFLGPRGGDLGHMAFPLRRAADVFEWAHRDGAALVASDVRVEYSAGRLRWRTRGKAYALVVSLEDWVELRSALLAWASLAYGEARGR